MVLAGARLCYRHSAKHREDAAVISWILLALVIVSGLYALALLRRPAAEVGSDEELPL